MEEWKQIPGFPRYWVSNLGNVQFEKGRLRLPLKQHWLNSGKRGGMYLAFNVSVTAERTAGGNHKKKTFKTHKIVALLFIGPVPPQRPVVMHLDEMKENNQWDNLQYGTQLENVQRYEAHMKSKGFIRRGFNQGWFHSETGERAS